MTPFEITQLAMQVVGAVALFGTLYVYYRQMRTMGYQLEASREAAAGQHLLALIGFLQSPEVREARRIVRDSLARKPYSAWSEEERKSATVACSTYDVAGILIRSGMVPLEPIVDSWGPSIRDCHDVARPLLDDLRQPSKSGATYWDDFGWLYHRSHATRSLAPAQQADRADSRSLH